MKRTVIVSVVFCLSLSPAMGQGTKAAKKVKVFEIKVITDRPEAIYKAGETATFRAEWAGDEKRGEMDAKYLLSRDGVGVVAKGEGKVGAEPLIITGTLKEPGFLTCSVAVEEKGKAKLTGLAAAAFDPLEIKPSMPAPDDFDTFWADQKKQLSAIPIKAKLTPVKHKNKSIDVFDAQVDCLGSRPVSGYFALPKDAKPKSLPAVLHVHGAGVGDSSMGAAAKDAEKGYMGMDINAHGIPNGKPKEFYEALGAGELKDYRFEGRESRDTIYFRGMYLRLIRAMEFLTSRPEWDGKTLVVMGTSQGGGQAIVAAGLNPQVTAIAAGVPALCDHSGAVIGRINGWPKIVPPLKDGKPDPKILEAARYIDAVNFAARTKADAIFSIGFIDATCPPTTDYAAYNVLQGKKEVITRPLMGHAGPPDINQSFQKFVDEHIKARSMLAK